MTEAVRIRLRSLLVARYAQLRRKLELIVGSRDGAHDALQETWLRLESVPDSAVVRNPDAYLLQIAANVAARQHRRDDLLTVDDVDAMFQVRDERHDPERIAASRREIERLEHVLRALTPRCRAVFMAAKLDGMLNTEIAEHFGISKSLVEKELSAALRACQQAVDRPVTSRRGSARGL